MIYLRPDGSTHFNVAMAYLDNIKDIITDITGYQFYKEPVTNDNYGDYDDEILDIDEDIEYDEISEPNKDITNDESFPEADKEKDDPEEVLSNNNSNDNSNDNTTIEI